MDEDVLNDLKQFIAATVSQATSGMATKEDLAGLTSKEDLLAVRQGLTSLEQRMNERFDELDTKLTTIADAHAETLEDHEARLGRLETGTA